jgi:hypothetical protein
VGETISFRLKGDRAKFTRRIIGFEDGLIIFRDFDVDPKEISHLYVDKKTRTWYIFKYKYQYALPMLGAELILLELINIGKLSQEDLVLGGSLMVAGLLAKLLISKKIKIKGKRKLLIIR